MIILLVGNFILNFIVYTEPRIYFSLEGQVLSLALLNLVAPLFTDFALQTKLVPGTANASKCHLELVLSKVMISI